ncbi:hypothetical protein COCOBI_12-1570 [Coccomyxa sp. Obi]|nr:hypothetical protein COCOBI_12-1570 [Coccomyxa sp. Obi]
MAAPTKTLLRDVLVDFFLEALQIGGVEVQEASHYKEALSGAAISAPIDVIRNLDQLQKLFAGRLSSEEIICLRVAAYRLSGVKDPDNFDSSTEFELFAWDEGGPDVAKFARPIWNLGFRSWAAIYRVANHNYDTLSIMLNLNLQTVADAFEMSRICHFAKVHSRMQTLKTTLQDALERPRMDINVASSSQSDKSRNKHPETVQEWCGFGDDERQYRDLKPPTKRRFISRPLTGEGPAKEYSVSRVFDEQIGCVINAGVKYDKREELLEKDGKAYALWEPQGTTVPTDQELLKWARAAAQDEAVDALRESLEEVFLENAHAAAKIRVKINSFYDQLLKDVDFSLPGVIRRGRAVAELKRLERLVCELQLEGQEWATQHAPPFVDLWNHPDDSALCKNVIGAIDQWNQYASELGIRHGLIFTQLWTWAIQADGRNNLRISPGFRYNSTNPTVLEVVDFVTHLALSPDGICDPWETSEWHPPRRPVDNPLGGPANWTRSRTAARQAPQGSAQQAPQGGAQQPPQSSAQQSPQGSAAQISSKMDVDPPGTPQSVLRADFSGSDSSPENKETIRLAQVAAALVVDWIRGVLGRGALGEVFRARMPSGRPVALKLAGSGDPEEHLLQNEARAYLALQDLWGKGVPELVLAGPLVAFGSGYALGTSLLPGRPLQHGDSELLPEALAILSQVHAKGIIHQDLRRENFIVNELDTPQGVQKTLFLLDFSNCEFNADEEAQRRELCDLKRLFEAL